MMRTRDITLTQTKDEPVKVKVRISDGTVRSAWIVGCKDGYVLFAPTKRTKARWWLPFDFVKKYGEIVR